MMRQMAGNKESMKVGVQMWFSTPAFLLNMFQRANPKVQVADIAAVMDELRMIKDESEIKLMRKAARIAMVGMDTASRWLKPELQRTRSALRSNTQCVRPVEMGSRHPFS